MSRFYTILAKSLSVILYPLFVPTYGMALFCYAYSLHTETPFPWIWTTIAIVGTFVLTCVLPITAIWILMRRGTVTDLNINDARERTMPYLYSMMGFGFWAYLMIAVLHAPLSLAYVSVGATVAIGLISLINRWWKISAHLTGLGGLIGGLFSYCLEIGALPTWGTLVLWFGLTWLLMAARLYLNAHTSTQVCAGWLLGMICTFLPYCIAIHV